MENYFTKLYSVDCNDKTEKKNGLTYLSWAWAWAEIKKQFPDAMYTIYENNLGWNYFTDGRTCWVKTGVTVNGIEHIEYLPVMDFRNKSIPTEQVTSFEVNKAIQRSLTKACARHGLGLYIYAGEDLPEDAEEKTEKPVAPSKTSVKAQNSSTKAAKAETAPIVQAETKKPTLNDMPTLGAFISEDRDITVDEAKTMVIESGEGQGLTLRDTYLASCKNGEQIRKNIINDPNASKVMKRAIFVLDNAIKTKKAG